MFELKTSHLILRDILESDFASMHRLRTNPDVTRYMDYIQSESEQDTRDWIVGTMFHNVLVPRSSFNLAIVRKADATILGWIGIGHAEETTYGELDFGYALHPEHWGHGYATEALRAILSLGFETFPVHAITGECDAANSASARVMEKAGMSLVYEDDEDRVFVVTREEWEQA